MAASTCASSVKFAFESMDYGPVIESDSLAQDWLNNHERQFGCYINGSHIKKKENPKSDVHNPSTEQIISTVFHAEENEVDNAIKAANNAYNTWRKLCGHTRAKHLYSIARHLQKHQQLLTVLETLNNGKNVREVRDYDVPNVIRCFYHHAGWAELMDTEFAKYTSLGVSSIILPWNFPLMHLAWLVAPALATGNTVVIKPACRTPLSAFLFAEICKESGLPDGVVNVVSGHGPKIGSYLASHPNVNKVSFIGSREVGKDLRRLTSGTTKHLSLELGGKSAMIVFENADLDAAVEGVIDGMFLNNGQVCCAGSRLMVQEPVFDSFIAKLKLRMSKLRIGNAFDKSCDLGAIISREQVIGIDSYVKDALKEGALVFQKSELPKIGHYYCPTLITRINPGAKVVMEEVFGPVLVAMPFRTAKEAVSLANNTSYGLAASIWTEHSALALEVAKGLHVGTVWINCHHAFDSASGFGGCRQSGFERCGGKEGLYAFLQPFWQTGRAHQDVKVDLKTFGTENKGDVPYESHKVGDSVSIDSTYKLYIGGAQKRPDGNFCRSIVGVEKKVLGQVGVSSRKDVRNAVEAARKIQTSWGKRSGHNKAQILYYIAENVEKRREEFVRQLLQATGEDRGKAENEVELSLQRLFYWAAYCDKYGGCVQETNFEGVTMCLNEAIGVVGIICPAEYPLLGFVSLLAPAIARGNAIVISPSQQHPLVALDMYQVFDTSDLPGGVVNILTGNSDHIARNLAEHHDVDAVWYFGSAEGSKMVEYEASHNLKRTWTNYGFPRNWADGDQGKGNEFLQNATRTKSVWIPVGESFAN